MPSRLRHLLLAVCVVFACARPAAASLLPLFAAASPGQQCRQAIAQAERGSQLPPHLLAAIARVESGRVDPQTGAVSPWPWSINVEGQDHVYDTEAQAIAAVRSFQASGIRSIDVGCMQINLLHHPDAFTSLEQAFDPQANAAYAARFLIELRGQTGSWEKATAWYHSATPELGDPYQRKVSSVLPEEARLAASAPALSGPMTGGMMGGMTGGMMGGFRPVIGSGMGAGLISPTHLDRPRMLPMPGGSGGGMAIGRTLDSYRNFPVTLAQR